MVPRELAIAVLKYAIAAAGLTVAAVYGVVLWANLPITAAALALLVLGTAGILLLLSGVAPQAESAGAAAESAFGGDDVDVDRSDWRSIAGRQIVGLYLLGLGVHGFLGPLVIYTTA